MLTKEQRKYLWDYTQIFEPNKAANQIPPPEYYHEYAKVTKISTRTIPTAAGETKLDLVEQEDRPANSAVMVYFYGGGFGNPHGDRHTWYCRRLAAEMNIMIVDCYYALNGQAGFPIPENECYDVCKWVSDNAAELGVDPEKIIVSGGSSGASLSMSVAMLNCERKGFNIAQLVLIYPGARQDLDRGTTLLRIHTMLHCETPEESRDPIVSPLLAPADRFIGFPETLFICADEDFLLPEEKELIDKFIGMNIPINFRIHKGIHGFIVRWGGEYDEAIIDMEAQINARLAVIDAMKNRNI